MMPCHLADRNEYFRGLLPPPSGYSSEDGSSRFLEKVGTYQLNYMASHPRRKKSSYSPP
jgi:hypothetical protein